MIVNYNFREFLSISSDLKAVQASITKTILDKIKKTPRIRDNSGLSSFWSFLHL